MDGPRVPSMSSEATAEDATTASLVESLSKENMEAICRVLHAAYEFLKHLEHKEPRVRTLVAKAVGAYCQHGSDTANLTEIQGKLVLFTAQHSRSHSRRS